MIALTTTCRPHWQPWLLHQLAKQEHTFTLFMFDDSTSGIKKPHGRVEICRPSNRLQLSLGQKRQCLLDLIKDSSEPFAWFDDDDWQPKERLYVASALLQYKGHVDVVGCRDGLFIAHDTLQTRKLEYPPLIFNSAVFAPECASVPFQPLHRGEDTNWLERVCKDRVLVTTPELQHGWVSHQGNVTGKRGSMTFSGPRFTKLDSWEKSFLETNLR